MADEKKPEAKAGPAPSFFAHPDPFVEIVWTTLAILIILYFINAFLSNAWSVFNSNFYSTGLLGKIVSFFLSLFYFFLKVKFILFFIAALMLIYIHHLAKKITQLRLIEKKLLYPEVFVENKGVVNPRWERIMTHIESFNENDWRLSIMEADIMLDELLDKLNISGETIGEKLKKIEKSDFTTIDNAWEAHKIRNQIAHEGISFMLNQREAKRVISLYESVFKEFHII